MAKFRARKPRRGGPLPLRYVMLLTFVFFILSTVIGIWIVNKGLEPTLMSYAESQNRKIAEIAVSHAKKKILNDIDTDKLVEKVPDQNGHLSILLNPAITSKVEAEAQETIQSFLNGAEKGELKAFSDITIEKSSDGLVYSIPMGQATNNALLGNLGPKIPIKLQIIGDVAADTKFETKTEGISAIIVNAYIQLTLHVQTIIPFETKVIPYKQTIPLAPIILQGEVPQYYNGGSSQPTIQLPPKK